MVDGFEDTTKQRGSAPHTQWVLGLKSGAFGSSPLCGVIEYRFKRTLDPSTLYSVFADLIPFFFFTFLFLLVGLFSIPSAAAVVGVAVGAVSCCCL